MKTLKSFFHISTFILAFLLSPLLAFSQEGIETKVVKFETGTSSTTIKDQIKGNQTIDYVLNANAGQILEVNFKASNGACYFNLMAPGEQYVAYYNSSIDSSSYHGVLEKSGDQKIRVYLMRSAARRNETADFTLEISVKSEN